MVQKTDSDNVHTSQAAQKRLKRRYAQEARFKAMGLLAVLAAAAFLFFLVGTIVRDALPAFHQHYLTVDLDLSKENLKLTGEVNADTLSKVSYNSLVKKSIRSLFPTVKKRKDKKALGKIISGAAPVFLRRDLMEHPQKVGGVQATKLLLSDDADLFYKGQVSRTQHTPSVGIASPTGKSGDVEILSTSNEFSNILQTVKARLKQEASALLAEANGLNSSLDFQKKRLNELNENASELAGSALEQLNTERAQLTSSINAANHRKKTLEDKAQAYKTRVEAINNPEVLSRDMPSYLVKVNGGVVKVNKVSATSISGVALIPLASTEDAPKGAWEVLTISPPESRRKISDKEIAWLSALKAKGQVSSSFNWPFFQNGASRDAEVAGIWGAAIGSLYTMLVTLSLAFPIGVGAALYLEEFAPRNRWTDLIEVNINNLAAVPSIVFGLLGLAVFLNWFGMPRSAPIVGGIVLALMTLPTIIIASRAALKAVPPSIREAALGLGASRMQTVFQHVLPLAMPGILTGTIIGMAQALGETAPLLMIGMVAFIVDIPGATGFSQGFFDPSTVLPVQIFMWADFPELGFQQKTAAAILVLLLFLIIMNLLAVVLRKRFERRW